jgi:hypothetical protein
VFLRLAGRGWAALLLGLPPGTATAQHVTIAGPSGVRTLSGPNYLIGPDLGKQIGGNLFDSFINFGLSAGQTATFTGPASVGNIIAGVSVGSTEPRRHRALPMASEASMPMPGRCRTAGSPMIRRGMLATSLSEPGRYAFSTAARSMLSPLITAPPERITVPSGEACRSMG